MIQKIDISTSSRVEFQDVTSKVKDIIRNSGVRSGICYVYVPHTTAGVTINEHADPVVIEDITMQLERMVPRQGGYHHLEGNSPGHIKTSLMGSSITVFIEEGQLVLGTWQGIFFGEFDGPRHRNILVKIMPDNS